LDRPRDIRERFLEMDLGWGKEAWNDFRAGTILPTKSRLTMVEKESEYPLYFLSYV
jgi:hypothetical protein